MCHDRPMRTSFFPHRRTFIATVLVTVAACSAPASTPDGSALPVDGAPGVDAGVDAASSGEADIATALACGTPRGPFGAGAAGELEMHVLDTTHFPDALCNDGSAPVLYYRPYRGEANRNRWTITLRGGGSCSDAETCAARWCGCSAASPCAHTDYVSGFDLSNMTGGGRRGSPGGGIDSRDPANDNPLADYNQIQFAYCSSDTWIGNARAVHYTTTHPRTGAEVDYVVHFLGDRILAADLDVVRREGVAPLTYTLDGGAVEMPDLDEAEEVVIAGDSAGGVGVVHHLDGIVDLLRAHHVGGGPGPEVVGLIDSAIGPDWQRLDWSASVLAPAGGVTYASAMRIIAGTTQNTGAFHDTSCLAVHASDPELCQDYTHVVRHHVTTPFFVRMGLLDTVISTNFAALGMTDPVLGPLLTPAGVPRTFAVLTQRELRTFPMLTTSAEEHAALTRSPGVFAPGCPRHDTIHDDDQTYGVTIDPTGTDPLAMFDVWRTWRAGSGEVAVVTADASFSDTVCMP